MYKNFFIFGGILVVFGLFILVMTTGEETATNLNNVRVENGQQIIEITAKGGYSPRKTTAQANLPTILKVKTTGTFDCSAALSIPDLGYSDTLGLSEIKEITIPPQKPNSKIQGLCAMGMYNFTIDFV